MKQIVTSTILLLLLFLVSCSDQPANTNSQEEPVFAVEVKNEDDHVDLEIEQNITTIDIESPTGIGGATFVLESGPMPGQVVVRLHLSGLEEFRLISEQLTLISSVPSSGGLTAQSQRKVTGNGEQPVLPRDPLWIEVEVVATSDNIPLQDEYFEIIIPQEFLAQAGNSFEIQWIDFFR